MWSITWITFIAFCFSVQHWSCHQSFNLIVFFSLPICPSLSSTLPFPVFLSALLSIYMNISGTYVHFSRCMCVHPELASFLKGFWCVCVCVCACTQAYQRDWTLNLFYRPMACAADGIHVILMRSVSHTLIPKNKSWNEMNCISLNKWVRMQDMRC